MGSQHFLRVLLAACVALTLSACGGGGGGGASFVDDGSGTGGGGGGGTGTPNPAAAPRLGTQSAGAFTPDTLSLGLAQLAAGGSTGVSVNIVDQNNGNAPITDSVSVTFSSDCASNNLATFSESTVSTATGGATTTYSATGCVGDDRIRATATIGGTLLAATATVNVLPGTLGSINFVSATPTTIGLRGSGQSETSDVIFQVRDDAGVGIGSQSVTFALNTTVGGLALNPASGTTDAGGFVTTTVTSGSVLTSVRVTATTAGSGRTISSQSEQLTVSTAIPDQNSFSLSATRLNVHGTGCDGVTVPVTIRLADRYNNPVPDNTSVAFTTEGGRIQSTCFTAGGECTVNWVSQNPRPSDGRSTILAFAVGEESFSDGDGDGLFDDADANPNSPGSATGTDREQFVDLGEAFLDRNENGVRDANSPVEEFFDFNQNGVYDTADQEFNGLLCDYLGGESTPDNTIGGGGLAFCNQPRTIHVRDSLVLVMSTGSVFFEASDFVTSSGQPVSAAINVPQNQTEQVFFVVRDSNDQPLPAGTSISAVVLNGDGEVGSILPRNMVPSTNNDSVLQNTYSFAYTAPGATDASTVELTITPPDDDCRASATTISFSFVTP